jgi:hypothetical protein
MKIRVKTVRVLDPEKGLKMVCEPVSTVGASVLRLLSFLVVGKISAA